MDWKTVSHNVLLAGLFVAMVTMFNQVNGRLDAMNGRIDALNERMDRMQAENNGRFDEMQAEMNRRIDQRFDQIFEVLRVFEGRITRLEEKAGIGPENAE